MAGRMTGDDLLGNLLNLSRSDAHSFQNLGHVNRGRRQERNLPPPLRYGQQREQASQAEGSIVDGVELVKDDVVELAQVEKGVDRACSRDADAGDHRDHDFGNREDDPATRMHPRVEHLPGSRSWETFVCSLGLVA